MNQNQKKTQSALPYFPSTTRDLASRSRNHSSNNFRSLQRIHSLRGRHLCDDGAGGGALVSPGGGQDTDGLVVAGQTVDTRLDENQAELGVLVLAVALKVLADGDSLGWSVRGKETRDRGKDSKKQQDSPS